MPIKGERGYSYHEFLAKFFPAKILNRLETDLCSAFGVEAGVDSHLCKAEEDPKRGWLVLDEMGRLLRGKTDQVTDQVEDFYRREGWEVKRKEGEHSMSVYKGKNAYQVSVTGQVSMVVWIDEFPIDNWERVSALGG